MRGIYRELTQSNLEEIETVRLVYGEQETKEDIVLLTCDYRGMGDVYELMQWKWKQTDFIQRRYGSNTKSVVYFEYPISNKE